MIGRRASRLRKKVPLITPSCGSSLLSCGLPAIRLNRAAIASFLGTFLGSSIRATHMKRGFLHDLAQRVEMLERFLGGTGIRGQTERSPIFLQVAAREFKIWKECKRAKKLRCISLHSLKFQRRPAVAALKRPCAAYTCKVGGFRLERGLAVTAM